MTSRRGLVGAVAVLGFANVVVTVDFFGTNTALPAIGAELDIGTGALQWVALAYLLALAAPLVAAGRWADARGRRRLLMLGLGVLAGGQVVSAAAGDVAVLLAGRAIAGLGAALVTATGLALVSAVASPERRAGAIGAWSAIGAVGAALGPLVGGVATQLLSWRWFFLLSAPAVLVVAVVAPILVPESRDEHAPRHADLVGAATISIGLALVVLGGTRGPQVGWAQPGVVAALVGGTASLACFIAVERRAPVPLVPPADGRDRLFVVSAAIAFLANGAFAAVMYFLTLYLQQVRDLGPMATGAVFLAMTVPLVVLSPLLGRLVHRLGYRRVMAVGMSLLVGSFVVLAQVDIRAGLALAVAGLVLSGAGQALAFNGSDAAALSDVPTDDAGVASGTVNGIRQLGSVVGLAVAGAVFAALRHHEVAGGVADAAAFVAALGPTMYLVALWCLVGVALTALIRRP